MVPEGSQSIVSCTSLADELTYRYLLENISRTFGVSKEEKIISVFECVLSTTAKFGHDYVFEASALRDL